MSRYYASSDEENLHQPVTWWRGHPIFAAHFVVAAYVASMLATTLLDLLKVGVHFEWLVFTSGQVLHGQVWRLLTYGWVNPPSIPFVVDMLLIAWFGREVERHFGRRLFLILFGSNYLLTPVVLTLIGLVTPMAYFGVTGALALFVAFATIHPSAPVFFNLIAKWAAIILVAILSLIALDRRDWTALVSLWTTVGFAFAFVRNQQGLLQLPALRLPRRQPKLRVLPDLPAKSPSQGGVARPEVPDASMAEIDALLDKIARTGLSSLTPTERAKLEQGRESLLKRSSGRK
jgi:membrane associated rhomboid family serine protease